MGRFLLNSSTTMGLPAAEACCMWACSCMCTAWHQIHAVHTIVHVQMWRAQFASLLDDTHRGCLPVHELCPAWTAHLAEGNLKFVRPCR